MGTLQWTSTYSGNSTYNAPTAIAVDNTGGVYVTGVTFSLSTQTDYATLKFKSNGVQLWAQTYNYANLYDVPAGIEVNATTGKVYVTGASASTSNNYDYATVEYDATNGNQLNVSRITAPGTGFDKATAIERDNAGNIYITGQAFEQSTNSYDIKTIKLNASLAVQWIKTYDKAGLEDMATTIDVDNAGNVVVGGYVSTIDEGRNFILLKYDISGNLVWEREYSYNGSLSDEEIRKIDVNIVGEITVVGITIKGNNENILTLRYTNSGELKLLIEYEYSTNGQDESSDVKADNQGNIYVSGKVFDGATPKNTTIKYSIWDKPRNVELDSLGKLAYIKNQLIIAFKPNAVVTGSVDNLDIEWGTLDRFLSNSAIIELQSKIPYDISRTKLIKVFKNITSQHSYSITRLGDTIAVPPFWATFILEFPIPLPQYEELVIADSVNTLNIVDFAHPNMITKFDFSHPDDPFYDYTGFSNQSSLYTSAYNNNFGPLHPNDPTYTGTANNGIHAEEAWDITTGEEHVRVGIIDSGIGINHPEFQTSTGSIIKDGYDIPYNTNIFSSASPEGYLTVQHGSKVSGIIAAGRNNAIGVAGIAGGNLNALVDNEGVSLYVMKTIQTDNVGTAIAGASISDVAQAIAACVSQDMSDPNMGFGVHALNMSLGYDELSLPYVANDVWSNYSLLRSMVHYANRNNVTLVASRGNDGDTRHNYPSTFPDKWVVSVGASNAENGTRKVSGNYDDGNNFSDPTIALDWASNYGKDMDVLAPGVSAMIFTTSENAYSHFAQTSAAAPHVTGEAALLMSYHNPVPQSGTPFPYENLAPEDIEELVQRSADKYTAYTPEDGFGKINAYAALQMIEFPYAIQHFGFKSNITNSDITINPLGGANPIITLTNYAYNVATGEVFKPGQYEVEVYQIQKTISHTLANTNDIIVDKWARHSSSTTLPYFDTFNNLDPIEHADILNVNTSNTTMQGYCYRLKDISIGAWIGWIPVNPFNPQANKFEYTLYTHMRPVAIDETKAVQDISIYPNPSGNQHVIDFLSHAETDLSIELYDIHGRKLKTVGQMKIHIGRNQFISYVGDLAQGIYLYKMVSSRGIQTVKFIKQ